MIFLGLLFAGVAYFVVFLLCFIYWRERLLGIWVQLALLVSSVWAGYLLLDHTVEGFNPANRVFIEILRNAAWLFFVLKMFDHGRGGRDFWSLRLPWFVLCAVLLMLVLNLVDLFTDHLISGLGVSIKYLAPLVLVTGVLVVTEQWFRNTPEDQRWTVKFLLVGLCVMFGYDFLLYSETLLFNRMDPAFWQARGWVSGLAAPLIAVSAQRATDWNRELRISRRAIFFSTSLLLSGIYLLVMSLVGYYLKIVGAGVGSAIQIVFVVAGLTLFVLLATSGRMRSQVTVWLNKHFLSYKYDYRNEWMQANSRLASLPMDERYYQELLLGITEPLGGHGGALWIGGRERMPVSYSFNVNFHEPLTAEQDQGLLAFMQRTGWVIDLHEYRLKPDLYEQLAIRPEILNGGLWLLVPLLHQSRLVGVAGLAPPLVDRSVNWEDFDLLKALGEQLAAMIELKRTSDSLAEARQFEAYNQLSTFVVHDIKNVVAQLSLVVRNAEKHRHNPEFIDDALDTLSSAVGRMNRMLSQLKQRLEQGPQVIVSALEVAQQVVHHQKNGAPVPILVAADSPVQLRVDRERLVAALCHLVQNAQDATPATGRVAIEIRETETAVEFLISDTGAGMSTAFIEHSLFKPFVTSKGRAGMGIGVFETRQFARDSGGDLHVDSELDKGSTFTLWLPKLGVEPVSEQAAGADCG